MADLVRRYSCLSTAGSRQHDDGKYRHAAQELVLVSEEDGPLRLQGRPQLTSVYALAGISVSQRPPRCADAV
jgi:hypothetical protein